MRNTPDTHFFLSSNQLVAPPRQTNPETSSHYNLEDALHRSHPQPQGGLYRAQSEKREEWIWEQNRSKMDHSAFILDFHHILLPNSTIKLLPNMLQLFFVDSRSPALLKEKRHKCITHYTVSIIQELQVICCHPHPFWICLLIGLSGDLWTRLWS